MLCEERERNTSQVRAVSRCHEETWSGAGLCTGQEEEGNQKNTSLFRYRDSPEEIQGER